ncbi:mortality factor 4-like protein 1 [Antechinus flavipes]|uniref:mortality factor 4-like protein 1 n=1 Tax=Antechinus flavipes TaxID=38775 RepID=UPI002235DD26|nr:mortality factor 4-like protein 1 [Antechinus flavipes]
MAFSKPECKKMPILPTIQEGERVLTFHGPIIREAECIRVAIENRQVQYLVRYKLESGSGMSRFLSGGRAYPYATPMPPPPSPGPTTSGSISKGSEDGACKSHEGSLGETSPGSGAEAGTEAKVEVGAVAGVEAGAGVDAGASTEAEAGAGASSEAGAGAGASTEAGAGASAEAGASTEAGAGASAGTTSAGFAVPGCSAASAFFSIREQRAPVTTWSYEWIPESRVLRYSAAGRDSDSDDSSSASSETCSRASDPGEGSSHCSREGGAEGPKDREGEKALAVVGPVPEKKYIKRREVKVTLPNALKPLLVKDWELVIHSKKLFILPARKNVDEILAEYALLQQNSGVLTKRYAVQELVAGIKEYFNVMLGTQLLYKFERPQYNDIVASHPTLRMSQIYGGAHLLRLFVQLGSMLAYTALDDSSLNLLLGHMHDFLKYLASNTSVLFSAEDYESASAEYLERVE